MSTERQCPECADHNVPLSALEAWQLDAHRAKHAILWALVAPIVPALDRFAAWAERWLR